MMKNNSNKVLYISNSNQNILYHFSDPCSDLLRISRNRIPSLLSLGSQALERLVGGILWEPRQG